MGKYLQQVIAVCLLLCTANNVTAQVTGGQRAFEFLRMSNNPHVSALGGYVPASIDQDVSFTLQNPGLLNERYHNQLAVNYNLYYAGIGIANLQYAYHVAPLKTNFGFGVQYLNYGSFLHTDIYGNDLGNIRATDYSINLSASRTYLDKWRYGTTVKWAHSFLGDRSAMAVLADVGVVYEDTANAFVFGAVAKNMGIGLKAYNPNNAKEPLPFDLQIGISKQLKNVPLRLYMVAHHLYEWDIRYNNPADKVSNSLIQDDTNTKEKNYTIDKIFRHLNFGAELVLAKKLVISVAYSHLRRSELGVGEAKGLAGFSFGAGLDLNKMHVRYGRSYFATAGAYNEIGFSFRLNKMFNIGNKTTPWGWDVTY